MRRPVAYLAVVAAGGLAGVALTRTPATNAGDEGAPPSDAAAPSDTVATAAMPSPTTAGSAQPAVAVGTSDAPASSPAAPAAATPTAGHSVGESGDGHDHDGEADGAGGPVDAADTAAQFTVTVLNDRYDTAPDTRVGALTAWTTVELTATWPTMTPQARRDGTVRTTTIDTVTVTAVGADRWDVAVDATVAESTFDGPSTDRTIQLQLQLEATAGRMQVVDAVVVEP